jgi:uncharacterized membrane protein HdeD (DUF308 family)
MIEVAHRWPWLLALGILMIATGALALWSSFAATVASVILIGTFLLIAGIAHIALALSSRGWRGVGMHLLVGILAGVTGVLLLARPLLGATMLTFVIGIWLIAGGCMRIFGSLVERHPHWGWSVATGAVAALLGLLVLSEWPLSGTWFLGLYLGIDFIFSGSTWVSLALGLRRLTRPAERLQPVT